MTAAVVTVASAARRDHLDVQQAVLRRADVRRVVVWLDREPPIDGLDADEVLYVPPGRRGLRLAAARNAGADAAVRAGADAVIMLDADCVPGDDLVSRYSTAARLERDAVLCGPVTYLPPLVDALSPDELRRHRAPHTARPDPAPGILRTASTNEYALFWSLSFALSSSRWVAGPRFDERFEGYGGEDTDFAFRLRRSGVPLVWVGGADAYHQHHETSTPPVQHLDDILRNGALFAETWGEWPMTGWLKEFERRRLVRRDGSGWSAEPTRQSPLRGV